MYSLIITVKSINALFSNAELLLLNHYSTDVETFFSHGEEYVIPSLIWPPPTLEKTPDRLFMKLLYKVIS